MYNSKESDFDLNVILEMNKSKNVVSDIEYPLKEQVNEDMN